MLGCLLVQIVSGIELDVDSAGISSISPIRFVLAHLLMALSRIHQESC
jgi:hypothetical protein